MHNVNTLKRWYDRIVALWVNERFQDTMQVVIYTSFVLAAVGLFSTLTIGERWPHIFIPWVILITCGPLLMIAAIAIILAIAAALGFVVHVWKDVKTRTGSTLQAIWVAGIILATFIAIAYAFLYVDMNRPM